MKTKKSALGRGLSAILESPLTDITSRDISGDYVVGAVANIPLSKIEANPFQPRSLFERQALEELAQSIREQGIIQPVTVRKMGYDLYQLISGERRFKAAKMAGMESIPCFIRVANDQQMLEMALIENIHREDLNALDIAISYQRLVEECDLTHEKLSQRIGKKRATISNYIRLLKLPPEIQLAIGNNTITMGHARALINVEKESDQLEIFHKIVNRELSVRKVEELVRNLTGRKTEEKSDPGPGIEHLSHEIDQINTRLKTDARIKISNNGKGRIVIPFDSEEKLVNILAILSGK
ncbi:MAG: ParB/RepB/Spo0J family partition protein [Bacteroidales bacterium]|nr:ParB/RepB/Spo0J family partition protein [Bacteroidales bacterium]